MSTTIDINWIANKINISIGIDTENVIGNKGFPTWTMKLGSTISKMSNNNPKTKFIKINEDK